jgi:hypothetical protein
MKTTKKIFIMLALFAMTVVGATFCGNTQQEVNVKTLFDMLPYDALPEHVALGELDRDEYICECDYENGYLELAGGHYEWQMCYWNLNDGRKLVAVNQGFETGPRLLFFYYEEGELREDGDYSLWEDITINLEDFIDVSQLHPDIIDDLREHVESLKYILYYQLPQEGTAIKVHIDYEEVIEDFESIPYEAFKELTLTWIDEKWVKQ